MSLEIIYPRKSPVHYTEVDWELRDINLKERATAVFCHNKRPWTVPRQASLSKEFSRQEY